jgi:predicted protein tyrosine phosphatase
MPAEKTHYLFICSANLNRSKAAERICYNLAQAKGLDIICESAGVNPAAERKVTRQIADQADMIFVMEDYMKKILIYDFQQPADKIICLDIPDIYYINDPVLEKILIQEIAPYLV